jgi:hypothetical protein
VATAADIHDDDTDDMQNREHTMSRHAVEEHIRAGVSA